MRNYTVTIDVLDAVYDFYPGLSTEDATRIADLIVDKWDYTGDYNKVADDITWYADALDIDLEGKDGVEIQPDNIYVIDSPKTSLFPWLTLLYLLNRLRDLHVQVNMVNILCVLVVNQSLKFITLVGRDYNVNIVKNV